GGQNAHDTAPVLSIPSPIPSPPLCSPAHLPASISDPDACPGIAIGRPLHHNPHPARDPTPQVCPARARAAACNSASSTGVPAPHRCTAHNCDAPPAARCGQLHFRKVLPPGIP